MQNLGWCGMFLALAGTVGCEGPPPKTEEVIRPVRWTQVYGTGGGRARKFSGSSQSGISSVLSFKVAGNVQEIAVKVGDSVEKGQVIARIDPSDYQLQVQEAAASLALASAQERNAKATYDRARAMYESQSVAKSDLDSARAGYESATAQVSSVSKRLQLARRQLDYCVLKAPASGKISAVMSDVNENVGLGKPIVRLAAGEQIEVKIAVPEILISRIRRGLEVDVTFDSLGGKSFKGTIDEVGVAPEAGATTFPVTVRIENASEELRPGLAAEVDIRFERTDDRSRFLVPSVAVAGDHAGRFVFVVTPTEGGLGTVKRRTVQVGDLTSEGMEVFEGLEEGDRVVTAGVSRIRDGQVVRVPPEGE